MRLNNVSKLKLVLVTLIVTVALVSASPQRAHANPYGGAYVMLPLIVVAALVTFAATLTLICTPVAAIKASQEEGQFSDAFGDCWNWDGSVEWGDEATPPEAEDSPHTVAQDQTESEAETLVASSPRVSRGKEFRAAGRINFEDRYLGE